MKKYILASVALVFASIPARAFAHCPLCTAGAAAAGGVAVWLGVDVVAIGIFLGGAALSMGLWFSKSIRKQFIPLQKQLIVGGVFISTIIPLMPFFRHYTSIYVAITGAYGTLLHNVYWINLFLVGSGIGAFLVFISPMLSRRITDFRKGRLVPYQGLAITFVLLLLASAIAQFAL